MPWTSLPEVPSRLSCQYGRGRVTGPEQAGDPQPDRGPGQAVAQREDLSTEKWSRAAVGTGSATPSGAPGRDGPGQVPAVSVTWARTRRAPPPGSAGAGTRRGVRAGPADPTRATGHGERHRAQGRADRGADDGLVGPGPGRADLPADRDRGGRRVASRWWTAAGRPGRRNWPARWSRSPRSGWPAAGWRAAAARPGAPQHEHHPGPAPRPAPAGPGGGVAHLRPQAPAHGPTLRPRPCGRRVPGVIGYLVAESLRTLVTASGPRPGQDRRPEARPAGCRPDPVCAVGCGISWPPAVV